MVRPPVSRSGTRRPGRILAAAGMGAALALAGCGGEPAPRVDDGRPGVVVSVPPQGWFVRQLAGDEAELTVLVPRGASPALYEPTLRQMRALDRARVFLTVGHPRFPFERAWGTELVRGRSGLTVVDGSEGCVAAPEDPHLWLSPACAASMTRNLADALAGELPGRAGTVRAREARLLERIDALDRELAELLRPHRGAAFLVFHPSLGYFARAYGLEQVAIERRAGEPNPAELASVVRRARERGIHTVFVQPQFSTEAARLVARELPGGRIVTIDPLSPDWPGMMRDIARKLAASLRRAGAPDP